MKLYVVTLFDGNTLYEKIVKIFSTKDNLEQWMQYAKLMDQELYGDLKRDITQSYRVKECDLDNLDFVQLVSEARNLGAQPKSKP